MRSDLKWIIPAVFGLGALLAVFQPEFYITGWLAFSLVILLGLLVLVALWRWAGGPNPGLDHRAGFPPAHGDRGCADHSPACLWQRL